jgi:RHS repeat-associated protein
LLAPGAHSLRALYEGDPYTAPAQVALAIELPQPVGPWLPAVLDLLLGDEEAPVTETAAAASAVVAVPSAAPAQQSASASTSSSSAPLASSAPATYQLAPPVHIDADIFGNPLLATDASGALLWKERYFPYGEKRIASGSQSHRLAFHGKPLDADTGLQSFGARYYDPQIGRFTGVDPVAFDPANPHSFNRYAYGNNNPFKFKDPDGRAAETVLDVISLTLSLVQFRSDPSLVNGLGLAYDAIATGVPFLPAGVGTIRAAAKAADVISDSAKTTRKVPNPNGKKGGQAHQDKVEEVAEAVRERGLDARTEVPIPTPGGRRQKRVADVAGFDKPTGELAEVHQVGRTTKSGLPVSREVKAAEDIKAATEKATRYHRYN